MLNFLITSASRSSSSGRPNRWSLNCISLTACAVFQLAHRQGTGAVALYVALRNEFVGVAGTLRGGWGRHVVAIVARGGNFIVTVHIENPVPMHGGAVTRSSFCGIPLRDALSHRFRRVRIEAVAVCRLLTPALVQPFFQLANAFFGLESQLALGVGPVPFAFQAGDVAFRVGIIEVQPALPPAEV